MDFSVCAQCGVEIQSTGIHFRNNVFCGDECCEEFEAEFLAKDAPELEELVDDKLAIDDLDEDLGYQDGEDEDELDVLADDEFDI